RCHHPLGKTTSPHGVFWSCAECGGKALGMDVLRRTFARDQINAVWRRAVAGTGAPGTACPSCRNAMIEVSASHDPEPLRIDVCRLCHFLWFDAEELARFTPLPPKPAPVVEELPLEARQALALAEVKSRSQQAERHERIERTGDLLVILGEVLGSPTHHKPFVPRHLSPLTLVIVGAIIAAVVVVFLRLL
ncbi:MAG: zf-TFIIB domain-containing protein, partial [Chthoniobacterales bacterium]|nr:zf-TFIIB domain-containing protein [Chthoniobacterales bacterium]